MGDEYEGGSFLLEASDKPEEMLDLIVAQSGSRLVENDELRLRVQRLGDLKDLLGACDKVSGQHPGLKRNAHLCKQFLRFRDHGFFVQLSAEAGDLFSKEQILINLQVIEDVQFLVHERDPGILRGGDRSVGQFLPFEGDSSFISGINSGEDIHERRFSRAIFSQKGVNLPGADGERYIIQDLNAEKRLMDMLHF